MNFTFKTASNKFSIHYFPFARYFILGCSCNGTGWAADGSNGVLKPFLSPRWTASILSWNVTETGYFPSENLTECFIQWEVANTNTHLKHMGDKLDRETR